VSDELDEVASRLAQHVLVFRTSTRNPLTAASERRDDLVGTMLGLLGTAVGVVSVARQAFREVDRVETRQLYQRAADVGRDRANADIMLVSERLGPLMAAPDDEQGDELVLAAARRLVAWVAAGRPDDGTMSETEAAFARWADASESKDHPQALMTELTDRYVEAWAATLQP
jgi:hypothetical protein